jgi:biopolymer transport protein ExbD
MGRRSFSRPHRLHAMTELNVTPMLDLCFCLLIIFMISTPVLEQTTQVNLPKAAQGAGRPPEAKQRYLVVSLDARGQLRLADKPVTLRELEAEFSRVAALPEAEQPIVRVRGEATVTLQGLMDIFSAAKSKGLSKVAIDTEVR